MTKMHLNNATKICILVKSIMTCAEIPRQDIAHESHYTISAMSMWFRTPYKSDKDIERCLTYLKATTKTYSSNLNLSQDGDTALICSIFAKYITNIHKLYLVDDSYKSYYMKLGLRAIISGKLFHDGISETEYEKLNEFDKYIYSLAPDVPMNRMLNYIFENDFNTVHMAR